MIKRLLVGIALICLSHSALAVTSVCSGDALLPSGVSALRHEATWSLYDNWFYNLHVQIRSDVEGPVSPAFVDEVEMRAGGQQSHYLGDMVSGEYTLHGQVQIGHPVEWGFDSYHVIECQSWSGYLEGSKGNEVPDELTIGVSSASSEWQESDFDLDAYIKRVCANGNQKEYCDQLLSLSDDQRKAVGERLLTYKYPLRVVTGFIAAMGDNEIILRSTGAHYTRFSLSPELVMTRHRQELMSAVRSDDFVHIQRAGSRQNSPRVLVLRGDVRDLPLYRSLSRSADSPHETAGLPNDTIVTVISSANFSELEPIVSYARVIARELDNGELVIQRIEVLR